MIIKLHNISKTFKVRKRDAGIKEAIKMLFSKSFQEIKALDNISFEVNSGEIVGYIGPNGAGKSSSIKIMCGILVPDSGECQINGLIPWKNRISNSKNIGVVFGQRSQLWWDVPVIDSFELLKKIYKIDKNVYEKNLKELVEILDIQSIIKMPLRQLSLGQRMRCEFAASLLHNPKILFLDEPTIGLDALSKRVIREFIKKINKERGVTILLTTHDMQDIEAVANRIILIGKGKILFNGPINKFKKLVSNDKIIKLKHNGKTLPKHKDLKIVNISEKETHVIFNSDQIQISEVIDYINQYTKIKDISINEFSIEDIVVQLYTELKI